MLFDGRRCSIAGASFAGAATIDSVDGHDGHVLTKGHTGVAVLPALLAVIDGGSKCDGEEFLTCLVVGYEIATRAGTALHASVADYHCSGAWNAIGCAAIASRILRLDIARTREALGIAEYGGPGGQIRRVCAHPTMLKDGSSWGAHSGVTAALLARDGFTGAPAVTIEADEQRALWRDLCVRWRIREQYFKPYPVCRWAQPAIEAALDLQRAHAFSAGDIARVSIETFREAIALGSGCTHPRTTEEAQYSLPYPVAAALVFGRVGVDEIDSGALADPRVRRLLDVMTLGEEREFSCRFPAERWARVDITLNDGRIVRSEPVQARGDPERPLSDEALRDKYFDFAAPVLGRARAQRIERYIDALPDDDAFSMLLDELLRPA